MNDKPLKCKAYGSIPHLPGSRVGPGDHHLPEAQARIAIEKPRPGDTVYITEKLDGACVAVAKVQGQIIALGRDGYRAATSEHVHIRMFDQWVKWNSARFRFLSEGERIVGEWLALAHGTLYDLHHEPIVFFDLFDDDNRRYSWEALKAVAYDYRLIMPWHFSARGYTLAPKVLYPDFDLRKGGHEARHAMEGFVYRVENADPKKSFLCKWVRPDKEDGKYLPEISGKPAIWNWRPGE